MKLDNQLNAKLHEYKYIQKKFIQGVKYYIHNSDDLLSYNEIFSDNISNEDKFIKLCEKMEIDKSDIYTFLDFTFKLIKDPLKFKLTCIDKLKFYIEDGSYYENNDTFFCSISSKNENIFDKLNSNKHTIINCNNNNSFCKMNKNYFYINNKCISDKEIEIFKNLLIFEYSYNNINKIFICNPIIVSIHNLHITNITIFGLACLFSKINGMINIVQIMIDFGIDINKRNNKNESYLIITCNNLSCSSSHECVKILLNNIEVTKEDFEIIKNNCKKVIDQEILDLIKSKINL